MKIFVICTVRSAAPEYKDMLVKYVNFIEEAGHEIHLPHRDTDQGKNELRIMCRNVAAIRNADEIHIFYNPESQGTHFDIGVAFALGKKVRVVENVPIIGSDKCFARFIADLQNMQEQYEAFNFSIHGPGLWVKDEMKQASEMAYAQCGDGAR